MMIRDIGLFTKGWWVLQKLTLATLAESESGRHAHRDRVQVVSSVSVAIGGGRCASPY